MKFSPDPKPPKKEKKKYFLKRTPIKKKVKKATGELEVFKMIWNERPHRSQISDEPLLFFDVWNFAHILPKKNYEKLRLLKENIVLMTREEHKKYDFGSTTNDKRFDWVREKAEKLKSEHNATKHYNTFD